MKLRETTAALAEERRRLEELQKKSNDRKELKQRLANLRRANEEQKRALTHGRSNNGMNNGIQFRSDVKIGDADAGLETDPSLLPVSPPPSQPLQISPQQHAYISMLPRTDILEARIKAYQTNNASLEEETVQLQTRSIDLEKKLRRVVALCTGVEEDKVDAMVGGLTVAVESERGEDVEVGRVRDFLRRVEEVES